MFKARNFSQYSITKWVLVAWQDLLTIHQSLNPVGVLQKKDGSLITNLSATIGNSVNDFIDPALCILCLS